MDDIGPWLTALGLGQYTDSFRRKEIDLESITLLTDRDFEEMGVALGPRKKILAAIASLPLASFSVPPERRHLTIVFCDMVASTE
jgi:hypothetical protein